MGKLRRLHEALCEKHIFVHLIISPIPADRNPQSRLQENSPQSCLFLAPGRDKWLIVSIHSFREAYPADARVFAGQWYMGSMGQGKGASGS